MSEFQNLFDIEFEINQKLEFASESKSWTEQERAWTLYDEIEKIPQKIYSPSHTQNKAFLAFLMS